MRHHTYISIALLLTFFTIPVISVASGGLIPIGGRVVSTFNGFVTCSASYGPLTFTPFIPAISTPYFIRTSQGAPRSSGYILGLYRPIPSLDKCYNAQSGTPVPAYELPTYGVSR